MNNSIDIEKFEKQLEKVEAQKATLMESHMENARVLYEEAEILRFLLDPEGVSKKLRDEAEEWRLKFYKKTDYEKNLERMLIDNAAVASKKFSDIEDDLYELFSYNDLGVSLDYDDEQNFFLMSKMRGIIKKIQSVVDPKNDTESCDEAIAA